MSVVIFEGLFTPATFVGCPESLRREVCNGCGPAGAKIDLVPDDLLGLPVKDICDRHDWMYHEGHDRALADAVFIANLTLVVRREGGPLVGPRLAAAWAFYRAVSAFGGLCFGGPKKKPWWMSKTVIVNVLALAALGCEKYWGVLGLDPALQGSVLAVVNLALRAVTDEPLALPGKKQAQVCALAGLLLAGHGCATGGMAGFSFDGEQWRIGGKLCGDTWNLACEWAKKEREKIDAPSRSE